MIASKHARKRVRERMGLPKRAAIKAAQDAVAFGWHRTQVTVQPLRAQLDLLQARPDNAETDIYVHNGFVFIIGQNHPNYAPGVRVLVTVFPVEAHAAEFLEN